MAKESGYLRSGSHWWVRVNVVVEGFGVEEEAVLDVAFDDAVQAFSISAKVVVSVSERMLCWP